MSKFGWKKGWPYDDRKPCSLCEETKLLDEFGSGKSGFMGRDAMCRQCHREQWASTYRPKRRTTAPTQHAILSNKLAEAYGRLLFLDNKEPACLDVPEERKDNWFAPHNTWEHLTAKGYCHTCPAFEACLDLTIMVKPTTGVWAGLNPTDRRTVGPQDKEALRAEFEYQKANGSYMPSYLKSRKSFTRWDRTVVDDDDS